MRVGDSFWRITLGLSVGLSSRNNHALSVVKGETNSRIESLLIRHERRCISEQI
jgi:hypothetical protein